MALTRDSILKADDLHLTQVEVPEWGGDLFVRPLTGEERDLWEQSLVQVRGKVRSMDLRNARAKLVALCTVDEIGDQLFTPADVTALGRKNAQALDRVFTAIQQVSGLADDSLEEAVKNSD